MRLIAEFDSIVHAEQASEALESNGIATFISNKRSHRLPVLVGGAPRVGLWVVLDDQHWDATQLLEDSSHKVQRKLSKTDIIDVRTTIRSKDMSQIIRFLFVMLAYVSLFAFAVFLITRT